MPPTALYDDPGGASDGTESNTRCESGDAHSTDSSDSDNAVEDEHTHMSDDGGEGYVSDGTSE